MKRPRQFTRRLVAAALPLAALAVAGLALAVLTGAWQLRPIVSGSMEPSLGTGSVAVAQRVPTTDLAVGDVLLFQRPDLPQEVVHRVVSLKSGPAGLVVTTKGDANDTADPWTLSMSGDQTYVVRADVPWLGHLAIWLQDLRTPATLMAAGAVALIAVAGVAVRSARAQHDAGSPTG